MNFKSFNEKGLPMEDFETIGLAAGGQLLLNADDLNALLSGRRTGLLELHNLEAGNIRIKSLHAKLSLISGPDGKAGLFIHPIYRKAATPDFLSDAESEQLQKGEIANLRKTTMDDQGNQTERLVEFDADTREFIISDTEKILAPDMVNNEFLTPAQKDRYRRGEEVELADRTRFAYAAVDPQGIRSNKIALVASILIDGGLSYLLYQGLNALFNKARDEKEAEQLSAGYHYAVADMEGQAGHIPIPKPPKNTRHGGSR